MSLFLKLFEKTQEYDSYITSDDKVLPNVSLCEDTKNVHFNPVVPHDYSQDYFTMVVTASGEIKWSGSTADNTLSYSADNGKNWNTTDSGTPISVKANDTILWKGTPTPQTNKGIGRFSGDTNVRYSVEGNAMSLLYDDDFTEQTSLEGYDYAFYCLFSGSTNLTSAENLSLPATTLANSCYRSMFNHCTSLTEVPKLPSTTLADNCYRAMFNSCTSLTTAPELPATTLASSGYSNMFYGCTSLTTAPQLHATTLANNCYEGMFQACTNLTTAPELPATTLATKCYYTMFWGCTSLTEAPKLQATALVSGCYQSMFQSCTSLTTAPELPAKTLANECYRMMFYGCTRLTTTPELPATTLADSCYYYMFGDTNVIPDCSNIDFTSPTVVASGALKGLFTGTKITDAQLDAILKAHGINNYSLPVMTLTDSCYIAMFYKCTSLRTAPKLPATTLANSCYFNMFNGCTSLRSITCLATNISASNCTYHWVESVAASGAFTKAASMNDWTSGVSGIPSGWTVQDAA